MVLTIEQPTNDSMASFMDEAMVPTMEQPTMPWDAQWRR